jgi:DNA-directed RNA polymerase subunit H (RpoH/RPB5)
VTPATKSTLAQTDEMYLELFDLQDLQYNITKHRLQPVFERLPEQEAESFKKTHGTKFGTLRHEKPIARFYDYHKGDVIRVIRSDGYINYRIVR